MFIRFSILFSLLSLFLTPFSWAGDREELIVNLKNSKASYSLREFEKATIFSKEALRLGVKLFGKNHKNTAILSKKLADLYQIQGAYSKAEQLYEHALVIMDKKPDKIDLKLAAVLNNLAVLYRVKGDYTNAEPLLKRAISIRGKALGMDHPDTTITINNLYMTRLGKSLGVNSANNSTSLSSLAKLYKKRGHYKNDDGIILIGIPHEAKAAFDVQVISAKDGVERISSALKILRKNSPHSAASLKTLKKNGNIVIIYDPRFPPKDISESGARMASFFRNFLKIDSINSSKLNFPVVVSRYIVKWKRKELAFALAHELLGHGMQHLRGRLNTMNKTDSECEARLYQEIVHQDLGIDKHTRIMVNLRRDLEFRWCAPFKKYMYQNRKDDMKLWKTLNPDIPQLLAIFEEYLLTISGRVSTSKRPG
jgi:tetratricopeptide (TPR) repeat protein